MLSEHISQAVISVGYMQGFVPAYHVYLSNKHDKWNLQLH